MDKTDKLLEQLIERVRPTYYDKEGQRLTVEEWANLCEDPEYSKVKQEVIGDYFVSTVYIGLDMRGFKIDEQKPLIFETMIFINDDYSASENKFSYYLERYSTEEEALKGHEEACRLVRANSLLLN